ncbi:fumA [Symbiodinium microadriaticum]|nr:fumA [Symbiodinium microadriaticum]
MVIATGAAVAAAGMTPGAATKVFEYNRDNFMEDREQRMKKEFHERKYRVVQGQLWRQDVRDFVSLTEQKMSLYLIINVLLLSFTVTMWVEGQLPETTPDWLVMGYQIASVVAFSYLVLTIWHLPRLLAVPAHQNHHFEQPPAS